MIFVNIAAIFERASQRLKYPKIVDLSISTFSPLTLKRCGDRSKYPGSISVLEKNENWYGRIMPDGKFWGSRDCPDWVKTALFTMDENVYEAVANHGRLTGQCCFCGQKLTDERSLAQGYGPVCAENYGLPWGEDRLCALQLEWEVWKESRRDWFCDLEQWLTLSDF